MIKTLPNQVIALAGLTQAVYLVHRIARQGFAPEEAMETCIRSVFKIDAADVLDIYGGELANLTTGLTQLDRQLDGPRTVDPELARYSATLIFLEHRLTDLPGTLKTITTGVQEAAAQAERVGTLHQSVLAKLSEVYQATASRIMPRVIVRGEQNHLTSPANADRIRALLLAGIRSAVLWRQCGGRRWKLLFFRGKMRQETKRLLQRLKT